MRTAAISVLLVLLLVERSSAVTAPSSQCAYFNYYFRYKPLLPSLVPSISSKCLAAYNPDDRKAICIADCRSSYSVLSQCTSEASAARYAVSTCGQFNNIDCSTLAQNDPNGLRGAVYSACSNYTYCSPNCLAAIAALERYSGCCSADDLNGPKVVCSQQPIAPCSTVLNSGSVTAPTSECAYESYGSYSSHAEYTECFKGEQSFGRFFKICIAECRPYFALLRRCYSVQSADDFASFFCGKFNNESCLSYSNLVGDNLTTQLATACSSSTYCPPSCVNAIAAAERYGGCCYAEVLNGPKVLCGQQPIAPCSTIVSSGSAAIKFNLLVVMIFMITAVYFK